MERKRAHIQGSHSQMGEPSTFINADREREEIVELKQQPTHTQQVSKSCWAS